MYWNHCSHDSKKPGPDFCAVDPKTSKVAYEGIEVELNQAVKDLIKNERDRIQPLADQSSPTQARISLKIELKRT